MSAKFPGGGGGSIPILSHPSNSFFLSINAVNKLNLFNFLICHASETKSTSISVKKQVDKHLILSKSLNILQRPR